MNRKKTDKLNMQAVLKAGSIEKYSRDWFAKQGLKGAKLYLKNSTKEQRSERIKKGWITRKKNLELSTD